MRCVLSSDWHGDRDTLGVSRAEEVERAVMQSIDYAIDERVDFYLFTGDAGDPDSGGASFRAMEMTIKAALRLEAEEIPSIWIAGNHDVWEDGSGATCLSPLAAIDFSRGKKSIIHVAEQPRLIDIGDEYSIMCLPYAAVSHAYNPASFARDICRPPSKFDRAIIVAAHLMIPGVILGEETTELPRGRDVLFPLAETESAVARFCGHYHQRQTTKEGIVIPGALARFAFGKDETSVPGFLDIRI